MKLEVLGHPLIAELVVASSLKYLADAVRKLRRQLKRAPEGADYDPESTHQSRVLTRKASVALRLLRSAGLRLGGGKLTQRLKRLRRACGPVRDADIRWDHLLRLRSDSNSEGATLLAGALIHAHSEVLRDFEEGLARRRKRLRQSLRRVERQARDILAGLQRVPKARRLKRWLKEQVEPWAHGLDERLAADSDMHQLRISAKKLRYLLAAISGPDDQAFEATTSRLRQLQEGLGEVRDCQLLQQWLDALTEKLRRHDDGTFDAWRAAILAWHAKLSTNIATHLHTFEQLRLQVPEWRRLRLA